jgi:hypothetical protein
VSTLATIVDAQDPVWLWLDGDTRVDASPWATRDDLEALLTCEVCGDHMVDSAVHLVCEPRQAYCPLHAEDHRTCPHPEHW